MIRVGTDHRLHGLHRGAIYKPIEIQGAKKREGVLY
jgi:hypothetical protein